MAAPDGVCSTYRKYPVPSVSVYEVAALSIWQRLHGQALPNASRGYGWCLERAHEGHQSLTLGFGERIVGRPLAKSVAVVRLNGGVQRGSGTVVHE